MKLYPKPLKSVADVKRERYVLKYAKLQSTSDDLFSFSAPKGKKKKKRDGDSDAGGGLSPLLSLASSFMGGKAKGGGGGLFAAAGPAFKLASKAVPRKAVKGVVLEILSGYLKWKLVEVGFGLLRSAARKRAEKARIRKDARRQAQISRVHRAMQRRYGSPLAPAGGRFTNGD